MTVRRYEPLLELAVRHSFYGDRRCPDLALRADADTQRLIADHRLLIRDRPDGVDVLAPVDADGSLFIPLPTDTVFRWTLRLRTSDFVLFTELDQRSAPHFVGGPSAAPEQTLTRSSHPDPESVPSDVFATAEVAFDSTPSDDGTLFRRYVVSFSAASVHWTYYCLTDLPEESGGLVITDSAADEPVRFGEDRRRDLVAAPDPHDRVAEQLAARYPDLRRLRFLSDESVPYRQQARAGLELRLDDQRLLGPLPNPHLAVPTQLRVDIDGVAAEVSTVSAVITLAST